MSRGSSMAGCFFFTVFQVFPLFFSLFSILLFALCWCSVYFFSRHTDTAPCSSNCFSQNANQATNPFGQHIFCVEKKKTVPPHKGCTCDQVFVENSVEKSTILLELLLISYFLQFSGCFSTFSARVSDFS